MGKSTYFFGRDNRLQLPIFSYPYFNRGLGK